MGEGGAFALFQYSKEDYKLMSHLDIQLESPYGARETTNGKLVLPRKEAIEFMKHLHRLTHLGTKRLIQLIKSTDYHIIGL